MESSGQQQNGSIKVWDRIVRFCHWSLAIGFAAGYVSGEFGFLSVHSWIGYFLIALLLLRIVWGFTGTTYARFSNFRYSKEETLSYLRSLRGGQPQHYVGHNPAGAIMVFCLLIIIAAILMTGLITLAVIEFEGPFVLLLLDLGDEWSYRFQSTHEILTSIGLVLVVLHILGVFQASYQHRENLLKAMLNGEKKAAACDSSVGELVND